MTSIELKTYQDAKEQLTKAETELKEFKKGENGGKLLDVLRGRLLKKEYEDEEEKGLLIKEKTKLEEEKKRLEGMIDYWTKQVGELQLRVTAGETGNDFVTRTLGT